MLLSSSNALGRRQAGKKSKDKQKPITGVKFSDRFLRAGITKKSVLSKVKFSSSGIGMILAGIRRRRHHVTTEPPKGNPLFDIIGISGDAGGPRDGSVNHDKYLHNRK